MGSTADGAAELFDKNYKSHMQKEGQLDELYRQIGQLKVENDLLEKMKLGFYLAQPSAITSIAGEGYEWRLTSCRLKVCQVNILQVEMIKYLFCFFK